MGAQTGFRTRSTCRNAYNNAVCVILHDDIEAVHYLSRCVPDCTVYEVHTAAGLVGTWSWDPESVNDEVQRWEKD